MGIYNVQTSRIILKNYLFDCTYCITTFKTGFLRTTCNIGKLTKLRQILNFKFEFIRAQHFLRKSGK